ncbi:DUF4139 domain-containing protein [Desertibaculum subflavum]|uniref:DUF4139 domain-containing protein n=1 Tax=Desertibaculum subflavum TaxID=2268458 RepID=UPI0034D31681
MKAMFSPLARPVVCAALLSLAALPAMAADLALKRVMLSAGGVGYFEYEAEVEGNANLELTVRRDQVDDVLKSIVIYDDKGGVGDISLPGEDPLRDVFRELPFDQTALQDPVRLLEAFRGAEVEIGGAAPMRGRIVGITNEAELGPQNRTLVRPRLSLMTADGLRSVLLAEAGPISFVDPKARAQVEAGLDGIARNRARDRRTLQVRTTGQGSRKLRVAYVVEAPLWKAAYRLTIGGPEAKTAEMQGWAVLENRSGEDWKGVELTLVGGNPVTFRQALYTAYYVNRPEVPVEVLGRVLPRPDGGARPVPMASAPMQDRMRAQAPAAMAEKSFGAPVGAAPPSQPAELIAAESQEAMTQASYRIPHPVSIVSGHSLMVPLVARKVPAERLSLFQPATQPKHPLASVRLTNDSGTALPPGVLTLYERDAGGAVAFVGDARLAPFPADDKRLVSFAVDQKVTVDQKHESSTALSAARLADGLLKATVIDQQRATYTLTGAPNEPRRVVVDHPISPAYDLVQPKQGVERIDGGYRAGMDVAAGKSASITFVAERTLAQETSLASLTTQDLARFAVNGRLTEAQRKAFARLAELAAARGKAEAEVKQLADRRKELEAEQARTRANLGSVPAQSDLQRRYLAMLGEQEDRLGKNAADLARAREAEAAARQAVADYIRSLDL